MSSAKIFKTKTGYCHILPDKIVLTTDGVIHNTETYTYQSLTQQLTVYAALAVCMLYMAFDNYRKGSVFVAVPFAFMGCYLIYVVFASRNNSATPVIKRDCIQKIVLKKGVAGLTRTRFEVMFLENDGNLKKRLIMLPGSVTGGKAESVKAIEIMQTEGLLKN